MPPGKKKTDTQRMIWLSDQFLRLDAQYAVTPTPTLYNEYLKLQAEFDLLSTLKVEAQLLRTRQLYFEMGDKAGKLLAHQLRTAALSRQIPWKRPTLGVIIADAKLINDAFLDFYSNLYTSDYLPEIWNSQNPLEKTTYPRVSVDQAGRLGAPISAAEVHETIKQLQSGKSPSPDGFGVEFYKAYPNLIIPCLVDVYNDSFNCARLPPTLTEANISLLRKKDKGPLECSSYRPISLGVYLILFTPPTPSHQK